MAATIDVMAATRAHLLADSALATEVSNRIWAGEIPDDELANMPTKAILIVPDSARPYISVPAIRDRPQFLCYGVTDRDAWQVYRKLYNAMQRIGLTTVDTDKRIMQAFQSGGPLSLAELELGWPRIAVHFTVIWAETTIS